MKKVYVLFTVFVVLCFVSAANLYAQKCEYMKKDGDKVKVDSNGYIMSWLILDPYISDSVGAPAACPKDYFEDQGGEAKLMPKEGDKVKIAADKKEHIWMRLNFQDLKDMGQIGAPVGGNELDIGCWGGVDNKQEYLVTYLKWNKDAKVKFTMGADDAAELYCNGELLINSPTDKDWAAGNCGSGEIDVKGGKWNIVVVGVYESGGEWGISVQVNKPFPDEVDNKGPAELFAVEPVDKLPMTWGKIKGTF